MELLVALFEGDAQGPGLRLLDRSRDPELVRQVRRWFAELHRAEVAHLEEGGTHLRAVRPAEDEPES